MLVKAFTSSLLSFVLLATTLIGVPLSANAEETTYLSTTNVGSDDLVLQVLQEKNAGRQLFVGTGTPNTLSCAPAFYGISPEKNIIIDAFYNVSFIAEKVIPETITVWVNGEQIQHQLTPRKVNPKGDINGHYVRADLPQPMFQGGVTEVTITGVGDGTEGCPIEYTYYFFVGDTSGFVPNEPEPEPEPVIEETVSNRCSPVSPRIVKSNVTPFGDVMFHQNRSDVEYLQKIGTVNGLKDGYFHPDQKITHAELMKMLTISFGCDITPFEKALIRNLGARDWFTKFLFDRKYFGYIREYINTVAFGGFHETPSKAQVVEGIYSMIEVSPEMEEVIDSYSLSMQGTTRAEVSALITDLLQKL